MSDLSHIKKPTRRDLLLVIGELQSIIGSMQAEYRNDRSRNTADEIDKLSKQGLNLCVLATSFDPPVEGTWP